MVSTPWDHTSSTTERGYGWRWQKLRLRILERDDYLCQPCRAIGRYAPAQEVDHIKPKIEGGTDDAGNLQSICSECHAVKTQIENAKGTHGKAHPEWLPKAACQMEIVCGPAGGGKTTYAKAKAQPGDVVIDLDDCFKDICGIHGHEAPKVHLSAALALRNKRLAALQHKTTGKAFLIVSAPTKGERKWWADKTGGVVTLINPGLSEIKRRDISDRRKSLAKNWYEDCRKRWEPPKQKQTIGADGWPVQ